jgi:ATP adenylyltransferase
MAKQMIAPWRGEFIRGPKPKGCIFCRMFAEKADRRNLIILRAKHNFIVLNRYPYTSGHLMIVPNRHVGNLERLPDDVAAEMMALSKLAVKSLRSAFSPRGFNLGMNVGRSAGAGVAGHLHLHIVPRWEGDSNFMATTGDVRVISFSLDDIYQALQKQFHRP